MKGRNDTFGSNGTDDDANADDVWRSDDIVRQLHDLAPLLNESMWGCLFRDEPLDCADHFTEVLTREGVCYTFNMLSPQEIYREG